uniref:Cyclin-dependent kinases regulatory subunit n=2 Tax=Panagrellus redivivus TaxID=6233 RepID=A0A7E4WC99_PANRE
MVSSVLIVITYRGFQFSAAKLTRTFYLVPAATASSSQQPRVVRRMTVHPQAVHHTSATTQGQPTTVVAHAVQPASVPQLKVISPTLNNTQERNNTNATNTVVANTAQVHYPQYSDDGSPQSLPDDQLDTMYEYFDVNPDESTMNHATMGDYEYEEDTNTGSVTSHSSNHHGLMMQPIQHQIIENHQKYYKVGRLVAQK